MRPGFRPRGSGTFAKDAGDTFAPLFDSCNREADMAQAYHYFADKFGIRVAGAS